MAEIQTGLVVMSNDDYHAGPGISKSHLDKMAMSPMHYWSAYINPERERREQTPAMALGTAVHSAVLEPDLFVGDYIKAEKFDRRTTAGKQDALDFAAANEGKIILDPEEYDLCMAMRDAVHRHPLAKRLFNGGHSEQTFFAVDEGTGEIVKCRTDYINIGGGIIVDLKTTEDASPKGFGRSAGNFRYDLQAPWYKDVVQAAVGETLPVFAFVAVEKKPPYAIGVYYVDEATEQRARYCARRDFMKILECRARNHWPDYAEAAEALQISSWADR